MTHIIDSVEARNGGATKFVLGKKYKYRTWVTGDVPVICVGFTTKGKPICEYPDGGVRALCDPQNWVECREPLEIKAVVGEGHHGILNVLVTNLNGLDVYRWFRERTKWDKTARLVTLREVLDD